MRHTAYLPLMNQVVVHLITALLYKHHFECNRSNHAYCAKKICSHLFVSKTYKKTITAEDEDVIVSILL